MCLGFQLWDLLMPTAKLESRITKQWGDIGFQGDDPKTDFRGMGMLGLNNLVWVPWRLLKPWSPWWPCWHRKTLCASLICLSEIRRWISSVGTLSHIVTAARQNNKPTRELPQHQDFVSVALQCTKMLLAFPLLLWRHGCVWSGFISTSFLSPVQKLLCL